MSGRPIYALIFVDCVSTLCGGVIESIVVEAADV